MLPSLLYLKGKGGKTIPPHVFDDLQLTQLLKRDAITVSSAVCGPDDILARHDVFRSLEAPDVRSHFVALHRSVTTLSRLDAQLASAKCESERNAIFVTLMHEYRDFMRRASKSVGSGTFCSNFSSYFANECDTQRFASLSEAVDRLFPAMTEMQYNVLKIDGEKYRLAPGKMPTYIEALKKRTEELGIEPPQLLAAPPRSLSPAIIGATARLYPSLFAQFAQFREQFAHQYDRSVLAYRAELGFYLALCKLFDRVREAGIPLTYPRLAKKRVYRVRDAYDITLLAKNVTNIIPNDIDFTPEEPFFYLTGANGGGKTTYLRAVGVSAVFLLWGCPMPCHAAEVHPPSCLFTHFPRDERFESKGRSFDEVDRVNEILAAADGNSMALFNETYSATSEDKAVSMTQELAQKLYDSKIFGLYITHQHGLADHGVPFLNVVIDREDNNRRTFKVERRRAVSGSFARDVLKKYGLTREALEERFPKK